MSKFSLITFMELEKMSELDKDEIILMSVTSLAKIYQLFFFLTLRLLSDPDLSSDSVPRD